LVLSCLHFGRDSEVARRLVEAWLALQLVLDGVYLSLQREALRFQVARPLQQVGVFFHSLGQLRFWGDHLTPLEEGGQPLAKRLQALLLIVQFAAEFLESACWGSARTACAHVPE
jgi:hypothetical protein